MMKQNILPHALFCILVITVLISPVAALVVVQGEKIIGTDGATSPMIIVDSLPQDGTITINVTGLNTFVTSGTFTTNNIVIEEEFAAAGWTGIVADGNLTLTLTGRAITGTETVTVTFTGAGNPWIANTRGEKTVPLTATITGPGEPASFNFVIQTGGLAVTDGVKITTMNGATSPVISITDPVIEPEGTITINIGDLHQYVAKGIFTTDNVLIDDTAVSANWTGAVEENTLTLRSKGGLTVPGEKVTVTFLGTAENPWIANTGGYQNFSLAVTRTDKLGAGTINFAIETGSLGGLAIENGAKITSPDGTTSIVITILDPVIEPEGTITINIGDLHEYVARGNFTTDNVVTDDTAAAANWTGVVEGDILTLTSTGDHTVTGENVTVTFTGAAGNPWVSNSEGDFIIPLKATRTDTRQYDTIYFEIYTVPLGGLSIENGAKIIDTDSVSSPVITITNAAIAEGRTITINVTDLHQYVAGGTFTSANIVVSDTAASADWTGEVTGNTLTLTSTGGVTLRDETVTVAFTGEINPWADNSGGEKSVELIATRTDTGQSGTFDFIFDTTTVVAPVADFSASPRSGDTPLTVEFTDLSTVNLIKWTWDFGDGSDTADEQNPTHIYEKAGLYKVSMYFENLTSNGVVSKTNYITVFNSAIIKADTSIAGLTIDNCAGPGSQTITVDTSILTDGVLTQEALEIHPPSGSGFKNIIFYGSFSRNKNLITGNPTSVHLESEDIAPSSGFSSSVGNGASFYYTVDLPSYPCNAQLNTRISEGVTPYYDTKFRQIASANEAFPVGTAYTATVTKTNFPSGTPAKIYMSVNSSWRPSLYGNYIFIWRIADDETYGQILKTTFLYTENNLDYYVADSPLGLSTIGISATTGNNNPFQMIAFAITNVMNQGSNTRGSSANSPGSISGSNTGSTITANGEPGSTASGTEQSAPEQEPAPVVSNNPAPLTQPAMSTNVGMVGWMLSTIQNSPIVLVGVVGVIAVVGYFGWWKRRL